MKLKRRKRALRESSVCTNCDDLYAAENPSQKPSLSGGHEGSEISEKNAPGVPTPRNCPAKRFACVTCGKEALSTR